jgi:hypothetical protein
MCASGLERDRTRDSASHVLSILQQKKNGQIILSKVKKTKKNKKQTQAKDLARPRG